MRIYFSGIGGVGIGPLAAIASDAGHRVTGSDIASSLVTDELRAAGIALSIGTQDGSFLRQQHAESPIDLFVHTAALPADHPEFEAARELGIPAAKRDQLLAKLIADKRLRLIAVSGTHGKTTTTGMLLWALMKLEIPVSWSIGSTISFGPSGRYNPDAKFFVYECDEFDRNFLNFSPELSLITAINHDHFDTYPTEEEYFAAFRQFAEQSETVLSWSEQRAEIFSGVEGAKLLNPSSIHQELTLPGIHNRKNASLVLAALAELGLGDEQQNLDLMNRFPGTSRRFERIADNLYSDYGHHPVEIAATLQLARELSDRVVLVYQPHQNIRQHEIWRQYRDQFEQAMQVYWLPTYLSREDPDLAVLTPQQLTEGLTNRERVSFAELDDQLWQKIQQHRQQGDLVLCMGAGSIDGWLRAQARAADTGK